MERLCIESFLQNGHPFHLYTYESIEGVPNGTVVLDANQILPYSRIFKYKNHDSYAGFSNFFRYKLLCEKGGWWVDTDAVCLKPFEFPEPFVFSSVMIPSPTDGGYFPAISAGVIKTPRTSPIMESAWTFCETSNPDELTWGQTGPDLLRRLVPEFSLEEQVRPPEVFLPLPWREWHLQLNPEISWEFGAETVAVHLFNEMWRRAGADKYKTWDTNCLFEQLKRRYL